MRRLKFSKPIIAAMLCLVTVVAAFYPETVYIHLAEHTYQPVESPVTSPSPDEQKIIYFWGDKKHEGFFQVGSLYLLENASNQVVSSLFSITYATSRPGEMKLGFYAVQGDFSALVLSDRKFRISHADMPSVNQYIKESD